MITAMEELSLNAWPAHQTLLYDGWVLRFADGYTKRANSVNPLYPSTLDLEEKIAFCESLYHEQKLDVVYKLTPASCPENLDEILEAKGYKKDSATSVQVFDLGSCLVSLAPAMTVKELLSQQWLDAFCRMSAVDAGGRECTAANPAQYCSTPLLCIAHDGWKGASLPDWVFCRQSYIGLFESSWIRSFAAAAMESRSWKASCTGENRMGRSIRICRSCSTILLLYICIPRSAIRKNINTGIASDRCNHFLCCFLFTNNWFQVKISEIFYHHEQCIGGCKTMRRRNWRFVATGVLFIILAVGFFFFMSLIAPQSTDPVEMMQDRWTGCRGCHRDQRSSDPRRADRQKGLISLIEIE